MKVDETESVPSRQKAVVPDERIERLIRIVRGQKVMFDKDLAVLYGIETFNLNKAVKRNLDRFPEDFMFQLTPEEFKSLTFQIGISSWGGTRRPPYAFTELGVAMLSSVLKSSRAVQVNIQIMRAFVALRKLLSANAEMARKLEQMEKKYDHQFKAVFEAIRQLLTPEIKTKRPIGFRVKEPVVKYNVRGKARHN